MRIALKDPQKILIIKPSSLGDVVHSLPFLNSIKNCFPQSEIHWVIAKGLEGILEGHPMINKLWVINKDDWKKISKAKNTISELNALFQKIRKENFDLVIDLQGLLRSGIITKATGASLRIGFQEAREGSRFFYTHTVQGGKDIHSVDRYLKIADFLGCNTSEIIFPFPLYEDHLPSRLETNDYAVIVPGARWRTKRWPAKKFGKLLSLLPIDTVIVGSKSDLSIANDIISESERKPASLVGKTNLHELIEVMKGARFVVSNDSGPMHIAAALNIPVFAIFGPTDPLRTGPYGRNHTVIRTEISCAPCFRKTCDNVRCMQELPAEQVYEAIRLRVF
jgi:lipopolysaccharide heptosyltransferase I